MPLLMLSFAVYSDGRLADRVNLSGAYVMGSDDVPLRADIVVKNGHIQCTKRAAGPAGLAILWNVEGFGSILTETVRLLERPQPYVLQVELARGRLLRISQKLEDWGLLDFEGAQGILGDVERAREVLIQALQADTPAEAAERGEKALSLAVQASETLARFHSEAFLVRRQQTGALPRRLFGCGIHLDRPSDAARQKLLSAFDFVTVPITWREIEPNEQTFNWKPLDAWVELLAKHRIPIKGSALLSFSERSVPDWLYIWEHDFDTIRDLAFEHVRRVINRYGQYIQVWDVVSGIHGYNCFSFNFEQLMELTRMAAALTKQTFPRSVAIIDIVAPWGEYYSRNQRTIPPLLYADMVVQSGVNFDAFGLRFLFGPAVDGMFIRDMFQVSSALDQYAKLGKALHISAVQVPSSATTPPSGGAGAAPPPAGGSWREPWSEKTQAEWLKQFITVALSKPFVESVGWHELADHTGQLVANGGLLRSDLGPKAAYNELVKLRGQLGGAKRGERAATS
ncbi:MAG: endo-1,4-beta-xylanase [Planctomycetes bacterium]|nr:endo-1,4-beta-xylanase [Planctomycetota bacterium]